MDKGLQQRLEALGWNGVPFATVFVHIVWLYLAARLDTQVPLRRIGDRDVCDGDQTQAHCERAAGTKPEATETSPRAAGTTATCWKTPRPPAGSVRCRGWPSVMHRRRPSCPSFFRQW